jgi:IgA peptidase M64
MNAGPCVTARGSLTACLVFASVILFASSSARAVYTTIVNNGPNTNRVNAVFLCDGYTAGAQLTTTYPAHINTMLTHMFNQGEEPFVRYKNFFNVHRVDVVSNQSGADVAPENIFRDTALDARYYFDGVTERLLYVSDAKANAALTNGVGGAFTTHMRLVTVNDTRYGGGGGTWAVYAGGNGQAPEVALHELGHSFSGLADEYGGPGTYGGGEPSELNVTINSAGTKWSQWLGYNQPVIGTIGAYQGGRYFDAGIYRPSQNSKMRSLGRPFDAISREKIILDIYAKVDPLDAWLPNALPLMDPANLWVDTIDPAVISRQWFVNNVLVPGATGETFDLDDYGYAPGNYSVRARAYDPTGFDLVNGWVRRSQNTLEQSIIWNVVRTVPEPATVVYLVAGVLGLILIRRRTRG